VICFIIGCHVFPIEMPSLSETEKRTFICWSNTLIDRYWPEKAGQEHKNIVNKEGAGIASVIFLAGKHPRNCRTSIERSMILCETEIFFDRRKTGYRNRHH